MKDIYRELARRSIKDAAYLMEEVAEDEGILIPEEMASQFAIRLYQHRVHEHWRQMAKAEASQMDPGNYGGMMQ